MIQSIHQAILKTLIYADIFDYPLTLLEIERWFIKLKAPRLSGIHDAVNAHSSQTASGQSSKLKTISQNLKLKKLIEEKNGYYFLKGRENIVQTRQERKKYSFEKLQIARKVVSFIKYVPTVKLIGVTGGLAMENVDRDDDIDFLIISKSGWLWTSRFLVTLLVECIGIRRRPSDKKIGNKICLNMYLDEKHLAVPIGERNLFTSHEILQMKPLWWRNNIYEKFLWENKWVKTFLPNVFESIQYSVYSIQGKVKKNFSLFSPLFSLLETLLMRFQLWYMRSRRTTEKISDGVIRFHPQDVRMRVLRDYTKQLNIYKLN